MGDGLIGEVVGVWLGSEVTLIDAPRIVILLYALSSHDHLGHNVISRIPGDTHNLGVILTFVP